MTKKSKYHDKDSKQFVQKQHTECCDGPNLNGTKVIILHTNTVDALDVKKERRIKRGNIINSIATLAVGTLYAAAEFSTGLAVAGLLIGAVGLFAKYKDSIMNFFKGKNKNKRPRQMPLRPALAGV